MIEIPAHNGRVRLNFFCKGNDMKKLIAGNWKMNGTEAAAVNLIGDIDDAISNDPGLTEFCDFLVCPPSLHIHVVKRAIDHDHTPMLLGAQDSSIYENGAYTGDVSAAMLKDIGCQYVILGHSERRQYHDESSDLVKEKASIAHNHGLVSIICVGEKEESREKSQEFEVVGEQLERSLPDSMDAQNTVVAYEPVWAIGTGKSATPDDVKAMHDFIREKLQEKLADAANIRILYGGSVKPENASSLFAVENVDGALIGGASLSAEQFIGIAKAA